MILENSNIDKFFRDGLNDTEVIPPPEVWEGIRNRIQGSKKKLPLFYRVAAASVTILILAGSAWLFFYRQPVTQDTALIVPDEVREEAPAQTIPVPESKQLAESSQKSAVVPAPEELEDRVAESEASSPRNMEQEQIADLQYTGGQITTQQIQSEQGDRTDNAVLVTEDSYDRINLRNNTELLNERVAPALALSTLQMQPEKTGDMYPGETVPVIPEQDFSRWSVRGQFSPLYSFRYLGQKSPASYRDMYNNQEEPLVTYTGGLQVNFNSSPKLSVHTGIYYSRMGQQVGDIQLYRAADGSILSLPIKGNLDIRNSTGEINATNQRLFFHDKSGYRVLPLSLVESYDPGKEGLIAMNTDIIQSFEYLELPLLIRYKVIDRKIDFNVLGGMSANFMIGNEAYAIHHEKRYSIGKTSGLRTTSYSSIVGLGLEYGLTDKISLSLEPTLKYFLQSINLEGSIYTHPYSVGIFTGFSYYFK